MLTVEEKYYLYENSVQCHDADIDFINDQYQQIRGEKPHVLREDFGGTGLLACSWAQQSEGHEAYGIDLDPEPISFETLKIIADQREKGFLLDIRAATLLEAELTDRLKEVEREVQKTFRPKQIKTIIVPISDSVKKKNIV